MIETGNIKKYGCCDRMLWLKESPVSKSSIENADLNSRADILGHLNQGYQCP
jgi:hypothetical protein